MGIAVNVAEPAAKEVYSLMVAMRSDCLRSQLSLKKIELGVESCLSEPLASERTCPPEHPDSKVNGVLENEADVESEALPSIKVPCSSPLKLHNNDVADSLEIELTTSDSMSITA